MNIRNYTVYIFVLIIVTLCKIQCYCYDVTILPEKPKGGEGILVRIMDNSSANYEVEFNNKKYVFYNQADRIQEILLPLSIEGNGEEELIIIKNIKSKNVQRKHIYIFVESREIKEVIMSTKYDKIKKQQPGIKEQQELVLNALKYKSDRKLWEQEFIMPVESDISTYFAINRKSKASSYFHKGLDMSVKEGTDVKAVNNGNVILSENNFNVYGNILIIDHGQGVISCYFHLKKLLVKVNDVVKRGEVIAESGNTGLSTNPHLHFGIYLQGEAVDPLWFINFREIVLTY